MLIPTDELLVAVWQPKLCHSDTDGIFRRQKQPGIERVQALADISRSSLCCHSNETNRAPIANPPNSAQLESTPYYPPKIHPGPYSSMGMRRETD